MATAAATLDKSATPTDSEVQAWLGLILDNMEAGGIEQTEDTGQLDPDTVTYPGTNNQSIGYQIRKFTDPLASTNPVFIKFEFERGSQAAYIRMVLTIGTGSDGSGNITGIFFERNQPNRTAANGVWVSTATGYVSKACTKGGNSHVHVIGERSGSNGYLFSIERTRNVDGSVNGDGLLIIGRYGGGGGNWFSLIKSDGVHPPVDNTGGCLPPDDQTTGQHADGDCAIYPCFLFGFGETVMPSNNLVGIFTADKSEQSTFTASMYGVSQTMYVLPGSGSSPLAFNMARGGPSSSNFTTAMIYE